ncbi:MAG: UTP-glucose-1-phosphate uridylyltransferase [Verrucomicrobiales bacterium]|jgi:choline kinase
MSHNNTPLTLVVLAAGMGSRYGGLKQLDPVGPHGEVILDYSVYDALQAGIDRVVFVIRKDFEDAFRTTLGKRFEDQLSVDYAFQSLDAVPEGCVVPSARTKPWGTGHAVLTAKDVVKSPFIVINADDFYGRGGYAIIADYLRQAAAVETSVEPTSMVGFPLRNTLSEHGTVARGLCQCNDAMSLESVVEITSIRKTEIGAAYDGAQGEVVNLTGDEFVSMNMWGFLPSFFLLLEERFRSFMVDLGNSDKAEFYIPFAVDELIQAKRANSRVLTTDSTWFGVTYQEDKQVVVNALQALADAGTYPSPLWG